MKILSGKIILCLTTSIFLLGFGVNHLTSNNTTSKLSAWITYWDLKDGEKDLQKVKNRLEILNYFGAYFDKNNKLFIPKQLEQKKSTHKKTSFLTYLSFINDKELASGQSLQKDIALLETLFATEESMDNHIDDVITLTKKHGYDGIEIDYERLWVKREVGENFVRFINKLFYQTSKNNLKLRVILEPSTPADITGFAKGPEYVVMLYNLYGTHSEPGPKADTKFIERTIKKFAPISTSMAFSSGGCIWSSTGQKKFITQEEAEVLLEKYKSPVTRDSDSQALYFDYIDRDVTYTVWYADHDTLNYWFSIAKNMGVQNISLWRLGGNSKINKLG